MRINLGAQNNNLTKADLAAKPTRKTVLMLFTIVFLLEMVGGIYIGYFKEVVLNDAFSRTANAFYVLFIEPPRFASIGLVWNPLPSVVQLPFVALAEIWKPVVTHGIAAAVANSLFAALSVVMLLRNFVRLSISKIYTGIFLLLYATNPFIYFYGFNGMSEGIMFFFMIYAILCMTLWMKEGAPAYILHIAFALALAFFCRYEAIPFAVAIGIGILLIIFFSPFEKKYIPENNLKEKYFYAEATAIILYTPLLFSILLWVLFNWVITGNPLYFLNSVYSNASQSQYASIINTSWEGVNYIAKTSLPFIPVFVGIIITRIINKRLLKTDFWILAVTVFMMLLFHYVMLVHGTSYGWVRFFSYTLPISFAWLPYELSLTAKTKRRQDITAIILIVAALTSWGLAKDVLGDPDKSPEEHNLIITYESKAIADYLNSTLADEILLVDSFLTAGTVLNLDRLSNVITSASLNFDDAVEAPLKYGVNYILVPDTSGVGNLDAINQHYPYLYEGKEEWCVEVMAFDGYKLYKVIY